MDQDAEEGLNETTNIGDSSSDTTQLESSVAASEKNKPGSASPTENGVENHESALSNNGSESPKSEQNEIDPAEMVNR